MKINKTIIFIFALLLLLILAAIIFNLILTERVVTKTKKSAHEINKAITRNEQLLSLRDVSMESPVECNIDPAIQTWLISYASGEETYFANQFALNQSAINKCIDVIRPYNPKHLDKDFLQKNQEIIHLKRGAGYWLWKPYIILKTLNNIPDGDIVLYVDSGAYIIEKLDTLFNAFNNKDIIIFGTGIPNRQYIKRYLLQKMNMDNEQTRDTKQPQAGFIAIKNSKVTRDIIAQWLEIAQDKDALTDSPSDNEYPEFLDHRHDQAILSLLTIKYSKNFEIISDISLTSLEECKRYFCLHRRRDKTIQGPLIPIPKY